MSAESDRRNAQAQASGYRNYYDYRVHNYGRVPAAEPAPTGTRLALLRGHRSYNELLSTLESGEVRIWAFTPSKRNRKGQFVAGHVDVVLSDSSQQQFTLAKQHLTRGRGKIFRDLDEAQRAGARNRLRGRGSRSFFDQAPTDVQGAISTATGMGVEFTPADYGAMSDMLADNDVAGIQEYIADTMGADIGGGWDDIADWLDYYDIEIADPYTGEL